MTRKTAEHLAAYVQSHDLDAIAVSIAQIDEDSRGYGVLIDWQEESRLFLSSRAYDEYLQHAHSQYLMH